jgi:glutathionylspermidine synthase
MKVVGPDKDIIYKIKSLIFVFAALLAFLPLLSMPMYYLFAFSIFFVFCFFVWAWPDIRTPSDHSLTKVDSFDQYYDHFIFIYGSLLVRDSLLKTLSREIHDVTCIACYLNTYKMKWGAISERKNLLDTQSHSISDGSLWASLVVVKGADTDRVCGAVIGVTNKEFISLKNRELNYDLADVTRHITTKNRSSHLPRQKICTFVPKNEEAEPRYDRKIYIREGYFKSVSMALKKIGFSGLRKPPSEFSLRKAYLINEKIEKNLAGGKGDRLLSDLVNSISRDMTISERTRSTAYTLRPIIFPRLVYEEIMEAAECSVGLLEKALRETCRNDALKFLCEYTDEDKEFLEDAMANDMTLPKVARVDMTISGGRVLVLEVNSDSPGGMRHLDILASKQQQIINESPAMGWIDPVNYNVCGKIVDSLINSCDRPKHAVIVEMSPEDWPTYPEMVFFRDALGEHVPQCRIVDLKEQLLKFRDGKLYVSGNNTPIDLVYKRILWNHMAASNPDSREALRKAYLYSSVSVVNSLGSRLVGNKLLLALLKSKSFLDVIGNSGATVSDRERKVINENFPETLLWGDTPEGMVGLGGESVRTAVLRERYKYLLKPFHGYGGDGILLGSEETTPLESEYTERWNRGYIAQEYVPHGRAMMPVCEHGGIKWKPHYYILGAYVVSGKCVAVEAKSSPSLPINMKKGAYRTVVFPTR